VVAGSPDQRFISASLVERRNLSRRTSMKRFKNLRAAVHLYLAHYHFVRLHRSLRMPPAMAIGIEDWLWSNEELVERTSK
jgi:hypothetical protein